MRHSKIIAAIVAACLLLCGCQRATMRTLFDGETVKVEQRGRETIIRDVRAGKTYILRRSRVRKSQIKPGPRTLIKTDSLTISTEGGVTTIETADGLTLTIERNKIKAHQ